MGQLATRHLHHLVRVLHSEHGRACKVWQGEWEVGRGDPYRNLRGPAGSQIGHSSPSVGKLRTWRRALGRGSGNSTKVPSERAKLSTGNAPWSWRNGHFP